MKIRSIIERPDGIEVDGRKFAGSVIDMLGKRYYFRPTPESDGIHFAEVPNPEAIARFLLISEAFEPYPGEATPTEATDVLVRNAKALMPKTDNVRVVDHASHQAQVDRLKREAEERQRRQKEAAESREPDIAKVELADLDVQHLTIKQVNDYFRYVLETDATSPSALRKIGERFGLDLPEHVQPQRMARDVLVSMQKAEVDVDEMLRSEGSPPDEDGAADESPIDGLGETEIEALFVETFPDVAFDKDAMRALAANIDVKIDARRSTAEIARALLNSQMVDAAE